ncbi:heme ABC transporter permease CcmB [Henriciella barbarensis]|uniref:Heme exporter protein B n=1 Tax=Henriciella barbarensis TaxID=86342 RepID=A0A399R1V4_9PROT|nr:heme exporter protein CcmB [Henriciella barbarensis]RIJ24484.1 heme ABC transporter permease CcmB [Henriciella barbarensis]
MKSPSPLRAAFRQALGEAWAGGAGVLLPIGFFAGAAMLVPFTVGSEASQLSSIGTGILWVALALASLVSMERVFQADLEDGVLELWAQEETPLFLVAAAKIIAHWLVSGLPLVLLTPPIGIALQVDPGALVPAMLAYGLGGLAFFLWGGVAGALAASVARGGLLISLLALPLFVPTAIFGALATIEGPGGPSLLFLSATTLFALSIAPFAASAALRLAVD